MQPGTLVRLKPDFLHYDYHFKTVMGDKKVRVKAEDILLFLKWDTSSSKNERPKGILLFGETLVHSYVDVFEPLEEIG